PAVLRARTRSSERPVVSVAPPPRRARVPRSHAVRSPRGRGSVSHAARVVVSCLIVIADAALPAAPAQVPDDAAQEGGAAPKKSIDPIELWNSLPFKLHGGAYLWHYEPLLGGVDSNTELYNAYLLLDVPYDEFNFHAEPRFRETKLRPYYTSNFWFQEIYLQWTDPLLQGGTIKAGKAYNRFGRFWDGSFFGNTPYMDGITLDPEMGFSYEGKAGDAKSIDAEFALQYFTNDASTNGSLQDRDTISYAGARKRDMFVGRLAPRYHFD